jgi:hypothetical protein
MDIYTDQDVTEIFDKINSAVEFTRMHFRGHDPYGE